MSRKERTHITDNVDGVRSSVMKHLSKQEFGRRLYGLMIAKGWRQSDLARAADIPKDSISTYIRGQAMPTSVNLHKLADTFALKPEELLPNATENAIDEDFPAIEMRVSTSAPNKAWLRINRLVSVQTAAAVIQLLNDDAAKSE